MAIALLISVALFAGFLVVLGVIAYLAFRMSARREGPPIGAPGGCLLAAVLLGAALFALVGFVVVTGVIIAQRVAHSGALEHLHEFAEELSDGGRGVHLSVELRGRFAEGANQERVAELLKEFGIEARTIKVERWEEDDQPRARVEIRFPVEFLRRDEVPAIEQRLREGFALEAGDPVQEEAPEEQPVPEALPEGVKEY